MEQRMRASHETMHGVRVDAGHLWNRIDTDRYTVIGALYLKQTIAHGVSADNGHKTVCSIRARSLLWYKFMKFAQKKLWSGKHKKTVRFSRKICYAHIAHSNTNLSEKRWRRAHEIGSWLKFYLIASIDDGDSGGDDDGKRINFKIAQSADSKSEFMHSNPMKEENEKKHRTHLNLYANGSFQLLSK